MTQNPTASKALASPGLIVREKEPLNLEMPFSTLDGLTTPAEHFYVRGHNTIPEIAAESWRLDVEGEVEKPFSLTHAELAGMEARTITSTMECAGNGRAFLEPQRDGAQWESGGVGTAQWSGFPLAALLERAGVRAGACEVILIGADLGEIKSPPRPDGEIHFSRSLPLDKARDDVLLATHMNGRPLARAHGFPLRAVVPGWYGMAAVKWLSRIVVVNQPYQGFYQTIEYAYWEGEAASPTLVPITEMQVKAQIARPAFAEAVAAGKPYRVRGAAWTGGADIVRVEVSTDAGETWQDARLLGDATANTWRLWEFDWAVPAQAGQTVVMARATDSRGRTQPRHHDDNRGSYLINHWLPVTVFIR